MKCYACHQDIVALTKHCPHCGALLEPTQKLLQAVNAHDQEAIIQLYKMEAHRIYTKIRAKGISDEEAKTLVNKSFKDLLTQLPSLSSIDGFEALLDGVSDNVAYSFLMEHNLDVQECAVEDQIIPITKETIQSLFENLDKLEPKIEKSENKHDSLMSKGKKKIVIMMIVLAFIVCCGGGYGYYRYKNNGKTHKISQKGSMLEAYLKVSNEYYNAVKAAESVVINQNNDSIKHNYPTSYKSALVVYHHDDKSINKTLTNVPNAFLKDLDQDGNKELILCNKQNKKNYITGIYRYDQKKNKVYALPLFNNASQYDYSILTNKNKIIAIDKNGVGTAYSYKNKQWKKVSSNITNVDSYMTSIDAKAQSLPFHSINELVKAYNRETGNHEYSLIQKEYKQDVSVNQYDLDGDGKKDRIVMKNPYNEADLDVYYSGYYILSINNHTFKIKCDNFIDIYFTIIRVKDGSFFILVHSDGVDEYAYDALYAYKDQKLIKFTENPNLNKDTTGDSVNYRGFRLNGNKIELLYYVNSSFASAYNMGTSYKLEKGKALLLSNDYSVYSDGYNSLDSQKFVLKIKSPLLLYADKKCTKKGITIPQGGRVSIDYVTEMNGFNVYTMSYKGHRGYMRTQPKGDAQNDWQRKYFGDLTQFQ